MQQWQRVHAGEAVVTADNAPAAMPVPVAASAPVRPTDRPTDRPNDRPSLRPAPSTRPLGEPQQGLPA